MDIFVPLFHRDSLVHQIHADCDTYVATNLITVGTYVVMYVFILKLLRFPQTRTIINSDIARKCCDRNLIQNNLIDNNVLA